MRSFQTLTLFALSLVLAVFMIGCGSTSSPTSPTPTPSTPAPTPPAPTPPSATADVTITIVGMNGSRSFSPNPAAVKAGQTVAWHNGDSLTHDVTADGGSFTTGPIAPGATSAPVTMGSAGSVPYHCSIHPTMVGTLTVQ